MTDTHDPSPQHAAQVLVDRGRAALRAGHRHQARLYFTTAVTSDPTCAAAWRGLADLSTEPHTALEYLQRAQALVPGDAGLRRAIQHAQGQNQQADLTRPPAPDARPNLSPTRLEAYPSRWRWVIVALILLILVIVSLVVGLNLAPAISAQGHDQAKRGLLPHWSPVPAAAVPVPPTEPASHKPAPAKRHAPSAASLIKAGRAALATEEWPRALALLAAARRIEPGDQTATAALYQANLDWGRWHAAHHRYTAAITCFDRAQALAPDNLDPARARRQATALRRGRHALLRGNWAAAIAALSPAYATDPGHPHVADWLYQAYCQRGQKLEKQGKWSSAQATYASALKVQPQGREAQQGLARAKKKLAPAAPSTSLTGKWIGINLSRQTLTAYQGSTPVLQAVVSTGTRYYPTPTGRFSIRRKYRSTHMSGPGYSLPNVPYAMFFVGGYAIHGTYWHSNFGTPMSHGCVNMRTDQAGWLYNWAPLGTPVVVHH